MANSKWIDVTEFKDEHPVFMNEKTGQRKIVKPTDRTVLDDAYDRYWNSPRSHPDPSELLATVRNFTLKSSKRDEDIAQNVVLTVFEGLETFSRADATAFTRWVRAIIKRVRLEAYRTSSDHTDEYVEAAIAPTEEESYADLSRLPNDIQVIAGLLVFGYSLREIAEHNKTTPDALRNKLARFRRSPLRNVS